MEFRRCVALPEFKRLAIQDFRKNVFNEHNILQAMDDRGGTINYEMGETETGECFKFNIPKMLPLILNICGLTEVAKRQPVSITKSFDGANMTKDLAVTVAGLKINDLEAHCTFTKKPHFTVDDDSKKMVRGYQSRNNCFPLNMYMGREMKSLVEAMRPSLEKLDEYASPDDNVRPIPAFIRCSIMPTCQVRKKE